jgi:hypothetical protein
MPAQAMITSMKHPLNIHDRFSIKAKTWSQNKITISTSLHKSSEQAENNS